MRKVDFGTLCLLLFLLLNDAILMPSFIVNTIIIFIKGKSFQKSEKQEVNKGFWTQTTLPKPYISRFHNMIDVGEQPFDRKFCWGELKEHSFTYKGSFDSLYAYIYIYIHCNITWLLLCCDMLNRNLDSNTVTCPQSLRYGNPNGEKTLHGDKKKL